MVIELCVEKLEGMPLWGIRYISPSGEEPLDRPQVGTNGQPLLYYRYQDAVDSVKGIVACNGEFPGDATYVRGGDINC